MVRASRVVTSRTVCLAIGERDGTVIKLQWLRRRRQGRGFVKAEHCCQQGRPRHRRRVRALVRAGAAARIRGAGGVTITLTAGDHAVGGVKMQMIVCRLNAGDLNRLADSEVTSQKCRKITHCRAADKGGFVVNLPTGQGATRKRRSHMRLI